MARDHTDKLRFDGLLDHLRAAVAGADMFDPKTRLGRRGSPSAISGSELRWSMLAY
jgi:hypothetical protein